MPAGGHHRHRADPKRAQKIREGSKRADVMKKISETHHKNLEVPKAEEELQKALEKLTDHSHSEPA